MAKYRMFPKIELPDRQWPENVINKAPAWCAVDLRDGNQALSTPMNLKEKVTMFQLLIDIGFKEIEVGFPSASKIEFAFVRLLIEDNLIPDDVYIQVLTQAREHLIRKTVESLKGVKKAIMHLYNSTSPLQRRVTFGMSKEQIKALAVEGTRMVKSLVPSLPGTDLRFEYSPESFSNTEVDYALEVCEAVMDVWEPTESEKIILNLPATVESSTSNIHADQIEWFCRNMRERRKAIISLHPHNDRGTAVAAAELGLLAGAERVEGTLFGNGERTGNLDIVTMALNMYSQGVDPGLNFHNLPGICEVYEGCTQMQIPPRQPYSGELVFTAFSGSHQDAIKKGMDLRDKESDSLAPWNVPYLPIDPGDIGRTYEAIIRINSQSGKGGVAYVLSREFGYDLPKKMHPYLGEIINKVADEKGKELSSRELYEIFTREFLNKQSPLEFVDSSFSTKKNGNNSIFCRAEVLYNQRRMIIEGTGNGPIDAFVHALKESGFKPFRLLDFHEHSVGTGSETEAVAYIHLESDSGGTAWGAGKDNNIDIAGVKALVSAFNRL
ncbi:MAG: 2-isopropylmalate synthase [Spirochaetota bacterium]